MIWMDDLIIQTHTHTHSLSLSLSIGHHTRFLSQSCASAHPRNAFVKKSGTLPRNPWRIVIFPIIQWPQIGASPPVWTSMKGGWCGHRYHRAHWRRGPCVVVSPMVSHGRVNIFNHLRGIFTTTYTKIASFLLGWYMEVPEIGVPLNHSFE